MKTKNKITSIFLTLALIVSVFLLPFSVQAQIYKGIDIYNGNGIYSYQSIKDDGIQVVIHKATEGTTFTDRTLQFRYLSLVNNFKVGYYHFAKNTGNPEQQAQHFLDAIKGLNSDTILWLDIENQGDWGKSESIDFTNRFVNYIRSHGEQVGIYTGRSFYYEYLQGNIDSTIPLWLASYGSQPKQFPSIVSWQYSETGYVNGITGYVDMNYFNDSIFTGVKPNSQSVQPQIHLSTEQVIQSQLNTVLGTNLAIDGVIGAQTIEKIKVFQTVVGITVDGVWGSQCVDAINKIYSKPTLKINNDNNKIATRLVQYRGGIQFDGDFGSQTRQAMINFQNAHRLDADGIVGQNTWRELLK